MVRIMIFTSKFLQVSVRAQNETKRQIVLEWNSSWGGLATYPSKEGHTEKGPMMRIERHNQPERIGQTTHGRLQAGEARRQVLPGAHAVMRSLIAGMDISVPESRGAVIGGGLFVV